MATDYEHLYRDQIIGRFGEFIEDILRESIEAQDLYASGELYNSVNVYGDYDSGKLVIEFNEYGEVLNQGLSGWRQRRDTQFVAAGAGTRTGGLGGISPSGIVYIAFRDIEAWTRHRGIPEDAAGAIFYSLKERGFEKKPWVDQALAAIEMAAPDLLGAFIEETVDDLIDFNLTQSQGSRKLLTITGDSDRKEEIRNAVRVALSILRKRIIMKLTIPDFISVSQFDKWEKLITNRSVKRKDAWNTSIDK